MSTILQKPLAIELSPRAAEVRRSIDGIICFGGEDWWYHNRGHYDMQMMRQMSRDLPVVYVNSIGMRAPQVREGRVFVRRVVRKLRSLRRGFVRIDHRLAVFSPIAAPGRAGAVLNPRMLPCQVRAAAREMGITRPLVWVACPPAARVVDAIDPDAVVYQRTDRFEAFPGVDSAGIARCDEWLKARADLTVFCARHLFEQEAKTCRNAALIGHGVDFSRFAGAGQGLEPEPADMSTIVRPRVGFIGGIDGHTFDPVLFNDVARRLHDVQFVLVGACSLPAGWCCASNVHLLGQRPYESVASYMAGCDVLIMPWRTGRWIEGCNPVKLREYLATGRPVVSTPFPELLAYEDRVRVASDSVAFAEAIRASIVDPGDAESRRASVACETWNARGMELRSELHRAGLTWKSNERIERHRDVSQRSHRLAFNASTESHRPAEVIDVAECKCTDMRSQHVVDAEAVRLSACILLAGGLRRSTLARDTRHHVLDVEIVPSRTLLDMWIRVLRSLAGGTKPSIPIRVIHDQHQHWPWPQWTEQGEVSIEREARAFRGPGGTAADACVGYASSDHVIVADAARLVTCDLRNVLEAHTGRGADVTVTQNADGSPAGIWIIRCGVLVEVPRRGYVDLKEQFLRRVVPRGVLTQVVECAPPGVLPLLTQADLDLARARALEMDMGRWEETKDVIGRIQPEQVDAFQGQGGHWSILPDRKKCHKSSGLH